MHHESAINKLLPNMGYLTVIPGKLSTQLRRKGGQCPTRLLPPTHYLV